MFLAFMATVRIPKDDNGEYETDCRFIYHLIWIMHLAMFLTLLLNQYFPDTLGISRVTLNTFMMLFQVLVLIYVYVEWIFPDPEPDELEDEDVEDDEEVSEVTLFEESVKDISYD